MHTDGTAKPDNVPSGTSANFSPEIAISTIVHSHSSVGTVQMQCEGLDSQMRTYAAIAITSKSRVAKDPKKTKCEGCRGREPNQPLQQ